MTPYERINVMNKFLEGLQNNKNEIAKSIMWEIGKSWDDSLKEVVRTIGTFYIYYYYFVIILL